MTFDMGTLWFEVALVSSVTALGHIVFAPFALEQPAWGRVAKRLHLVAFVCTVNGLRGEPKAAYDALRARRGRR